MLRLVAIVFCAAALSGCSSSVEEKAPLEEGQGGPVMSEDEVKKAMEESMKRGGMKMKNGRMTMDKSAGEGGK